MTTDQNIPTGIYYVIPAQVFEDDRLEHSETIFYALLSGLCFSSGYCFASNEFLAKRMKVNDRTIQKWLENLEDLKYIKREVIKVGMKWDRKIFLTHSKVDSKSSYETPSRASSRRPPGRDRNAPQGVIVSEEEEYSSSSCAGARKADALATCSSPSDKLKNQRIETIAETLKEETKKIHVVEGEKECLELAKAIDKQSHEAIKTEDICKALEWAFQDRFWARLVISKKTLEKRFFTIISQYMANKKKSEKELNEIAAKSILCRIKRNFKNSLDDSERAIAKKLFKNLKIYQDHVCNLETGATINLDCNTTEFRENFVKLLKELNVVIEYVEGDS